MLADGGQVILVAGGEGDEIASVVGKGADTLKLQFPLGGQTRLYTLKAKQF